MLAVESSGWDGVPQFPHLQSLRVASWNANALKPHLDEILAMQFDILAVQEVRVADDTAASLQLQCKQHGYFFFHGILPSFKKCNRGLKLDKTVPGVAFLVKSSIAARPLEIPEIQKWLQDGRFLACQFFINSRWVSFYNVYAPVDDSTPMFQEFLQFAYTQSHTDTVVCGDCNTNVRDSPFVQQLIQIHWCPLTFHTDHDFITFRHAKGGTSAIDSIILSPRMVEYASPIQTFSVMEHGHNVVYTTLTHNTQARPTWEVQFLEIFFEEGDHQDHAWQQKMQDLKNDFAQSSVDALWDSWCEALHVIHGSSCSTLGRKPAFRLRDEHKVHKLYALLQQAIFQQDEQAKKQIRQKLNASSKHEFRKWRNRISGKICQFGQWLRKLFNWCKGCSIPVPSCVASDEHGQQGYTTCLAESLLEIRDFYKRLYLKSPNALPLPPVDIHAHQKPEDEQIQKIFTILSRIIAKADASKAPGIDGLQVYHFKQLPTHAVFALAVIFYKAFVQSKFPDAWLICKVSCVPKKQGQIKVKDLRPLTVAPVVYRFFGKTMLVLNEEFCQNVDFASVGGIPKRSAYEAWFPAALACEASWRAKPEHKSTIQGAAIDTHKFFDFVPQSKACEALLAIGLPHAHVATWAFAIKNCRRHVPLNGAILTESFGCDVGIPQGDPVSMLAAASLLGLWTAQLPREPTLARVFVDDRLLLSSDHTHLLECFHVTEFWDEQHGFLTHFKTFKTVAFGNNSSAQNLWWTRGYEVDRQEHVTYLGVPLPCKGLPRLKFFEPIFNKCHAVLDRLIRAKVSHYVACEVIARKILPAVTHATSVARPTKDQIDKLRTKFMRLQRFVNVRRKMLMRYSYRRLINLILSLPSSMQISCFGNVCIATNP